MSEKTSISYSVEHGTGLIGKNGVYSFFTPEEAIEMANEFKYDPRCHNKNMSDENVAYWQSQEFVVVKKITTVEVIKIV